MLTMTLELYAIDPPNHKKSGVFTRLRFKRINDPVFKRTFTCDIVHGFKNEQRWIPIIKSGVGTQVTNLKLKDKKHVDGDSYPQILTIRR